MFILEFIPLGSIVIAKDEYWGTYRSELVSVYNKVLSDEKMARVRIIEMLEPPRQDAILSKTWYPRDPYPNESIQVFHLADCSLSL